MKRVNAIAFVLWEHRQIGAKPETYLCACRSPEAVAVSAKDFALHQAKQIEAAIPTWAPVITTPTRRGGGAVD